MISRPALSGSSSFDHLLFQRVSPVQSGVICDAEHTFAQFKIISELEGMSTVLIKLTGLAVGLKYSLIPQAGGGIEKLAQPPELMLLLAMSLSNIPKDIPRLCMMTK
jgi:hypothetical protein